VSRTNLDRFKDFLVSGHSVDPARRAWRAAVESPVSNRRPAGFGLAIAALTLVTATGCGDGVGPELRGASLRIYLDGSRYDEQTIALGETLKLTAQVLDATGDPVPGETFSWSTEQPSVVVVQGDGFVSAVGVGTAYVIARHEVGEDTARINVAESVTGPLECTAGQELQLSVGEIRSFSGDEAVLLCLPDASDGSVADYALMTVNAGNSAASILPVRWAGTGVVPVFGAPVPSLFATESTAVRPPYRDGDGSDQVSPIPNHRFHDRLRTLGSQALEPLLRARGQAIAFEGAPAVAAYEVGELVTFNGTIIPGSPCAMGQSRTGRVRRITQRAVIIEDTQNPAGGFTAQDYIDFGDFFDADVWPMVTTTFGTPSDIDRNGRAVIFFTVAVNDLPGNSSLPQNSGSFIGGFFYNRDLFTESSCAGSNVAEMFYVMVPDPQGEQQAGGRRAFSTTFVRERIPTLLVHEFQHLVNDSRRLHVNESPLWEETWLNEGLSHIAEELMFYRRAGLQTRQNLGPAELGSVQARQAFRDFHLDNIDRFGDFLSDPEGTSLMGPDELNTRGASWSFLRYAADRSIAGESVLWDRLVRNTRVAGLDNLAQALGANPQEWIRDWAGAIYADDTQLGGDTRYQFRSWNLRALFLGLSSVAPSRTSRPYPLEVNRLQDSTPLTISLQGGGAGYLRVGVAAGGRAAVRATVGGQQTLPPPTRLKVLVGRIK